MSKIICIDISRADEALYERLYALASPERKARADRFRRREDALRCVTADALLRQVLGADYSRVEKSPDGKPFLPHRPNFHFNLSHSGKWVAIAWGSSNVGLDVESFSRNANMEAVARRFFTEDERQYVLGDAQLQIHRFFEIWTGKEAYFKMAGTGITNFQAVNVLTLNRELFRREDYLIQIVTEE